MHMADALISPAVGGAMWAATAGVAVYGGKKLARTGDDFQVPLMGVLGAFIFAAQMINFSIPGTGSSGHLGGGMILAILLGPHAAFVTLASILAVQALLFGDGGLLALGCNVFNLGFTTCYVAYPLVYKKIAGARRPPPGRIQLGAVAACIVGLELGAFGVVAETTLSGISELPFGTFLLLMLPIHLAIGVVEGLVTAAVVTFVWKARPEILEAAAGRPAGRISTRPVLIGFLAVTALTGGALSWFASSHPDGLEWSIFRTAGTEELEPAPEGVTRALDRFQEKTALLPDYGFKGPGAAEETGTEPAEGEREPSSWPDVSPGTSFSGIAGAVLTMALVGLIGLAAGRSRRKG